MGPRRAAWPVLGLLATARPEPVLVPAGVRVVDACEPSREDAAVVAAGPIPVLARAVLLLAVAAGARGFGGAAGAAAVSGGGGTEGLLA